MDIVFIREREREKGWLCFIRSYQTEKLSASGRNEVFMPEEKNILLKC